MTEKPSRAALAADVLTLLCLAAAIWLSIAGPYRGAAGGTIVIARWTHALFLAAAIAAVRHVLIPSPSLLATLARGRAGLAARPALSDAVVAFSFTRPAVLFIGLLAVTAIGFPPGVEEPGTGRLAVPALASRFDANWYAGIAAEGYDWQGRFDRQQNLAFFPAFPMLVRAAGAVTGALHDERSREVRLMRLAWCGLVISLAAFFWAAWYFADLARDVIDDARARGALLLLASYPFAVFYSAAYTEALFLLAALGTWRSMRRGRTIQACAWGLVAGLARPNGFFLSVPLGLIALGARDADRPPSRPADVPSTVTRVLIAGMPVAGMLLFTSYLYLRTGVWFAWARMHGAWGRVFTGEVPAVLGGGGGGGLLEMALAQPYDVLNGLGVAFALTMAWPVWRSLGPAWCAYVLVNVLPPLFAGGVLSMGRLSSTLFPLFLALGAMLPSRAVPPVVALFGVLQGLAAVLFYTWRSLY